MFPLVNYKYEVPEGTHLGAFGSIRKHDIHTGVDLYCDHGDSVLAIEAGTVIAIEDFTGEKANSPWWNDTQAVLVKGKTGVFLYGEIHPVVKVGDSVLEGTLLGTVIPVLKKDKGKTPVTMLHMELYSHDCTHSAIWNLDESMPAGLIDITDRLKIEFARIAQ